MLNIEKLIFLKNKHWTLGWLFHCLSMKMQGTTMSKCRFKIKRVRCLETNVCNGGGYEQGDMQGYLMASRGCKKL